MFSGIVESVKPVISVEPLSQALRISVARPEHFDDLKTGDSIATDGVCLTLESFDDQQMRFVVGYETLQVLNRPSAQDWQDRTVNLERSLRLGDRIHGHLVSGHVEGMGKVLKAQYEGECLILHIEIPAGLYPFVWKKGSLTINGVSLTINSIQQNTISLCLIPETLKRTNLGLLKAHELVTVEPDFLARALLHNLKELKDVQQN